MGTGFSSQTDNNLQTTSGPKSRVPGVNQSWVKMMLPKSTTRRVCWVRLIPAVNTNMRVGTRLTLRGGGNGQIHRRVTLATRGKGTVIFFMMWAEEICRL